MRAIDRASAMAEAPALRRLIAVATPESLLLKNWQTRLAVMRTLAPFAQFDWVGEYLGAHLIFGGASSGQLPGTSEFEISRRIAALALAYADSDTAQKLLRQALVIGGEPAVAVCEALRVYPSRHVKKSPNTIVKTIDAEPCAAVVDSAGIDLLALSTADRGFMKQWTDAQVKGLTTADSQTMIAFWYTTYRFELAPLKRLAAFEQLLQLSPSFLDKVAFEACFYDPATLIRGAACAVQSHSQRR